MSIAFGSSASLSGLFSARPAPDAGQVGRFYFATDTNDLYRDSGTAWVLIGTARTYKVYTAILTQNGTSAPVATVLENTLSGTPVWSRDEVGIYPLTLSGEFTSGTFAIISCLSSPMDAAFLSCRRISSNACYLYCVDPNGNLAEAGTDAIYIEIRVYP